MILPHHSAKCLRWNESIGLKEPQEKANMFYSTMFLYYSLYDGAQDKIKIKAQFETAMNDCVERLKDN